MNKIPMLFCAAACLALCGASAARAVDGPRAPADPANAHAAVPATRYQSSLPYRPLPTATASPDRNWAALNRTVGLLNSMSLTMGGAGPEPQPDAASAAHAGHRHDSAPKPAVQAAAAGHHHHEGTKQ